MVATNSHEYKNAVSVMTRTQLEKFALQATQTMEDLDSENAQLKMDVDDVKKIDVEVIEGWRQWSQALDEEREKWADLATRVSAEKQQLSKEHQHAIKIIESLLRTLGDIEIIAIDRSEEGIKPPQLRSGYKKIARMTQEAVDKYSEMDKKSEAKPLAEDFVDESS